MSETNPPGSPECTIIIPVHGNSALTRQCLQTILEDPPEVAHELLVVDDASEDDTAAVLQAFADTVRVVALSRNRGFAGACNRGASAARGRALVFLNNDTVPRTGWLDALWGHAGTHPSAAAIGSKLLYPDGSVQHAGIVIGGDRDPWHRYAGFPADHPAVQSPQSLSAVTGACFLISRSLFDEVGGFDESFENGYEDVDLCLRLRERGHEVHYCPRSVLVHLEAASGEARTRYSRENHALYRSRWAHRLRPDDLEQYVADGLFRIDYRATYPLKVEVSPRLATVEIDGEVDEVGRVLVARAWQLLRLREENRTLRMALEMPMAAVATTDRTAVARPEDEPVAADDQDLPLPPRLLRYRVSGGDEAGGFSSGGPLSLATLTDALARIDRCLGDFSDIYDFGCGCGRLLRWLRREAPAARISASDTDVAAVAWVRRHLPGIDVRINNRLPPLPFAAERFDLVLAYSVFTHLDETYQDAWLAELARVCRPGAILLLTVHGPRAWQSFLDTVTPIWEPADVAALDCELSSVGFLHWAGDDWHYYFPGYYHTSWHRDFYVRERWSRHFEVLGIHPAASAAVQDVVVLRRA